MSDRDHAAAAEAVPPTAPLILGVSGLRGIVGESLTPEVVVRYVGALATWLSHNKFGHFEEVGGLVLVGHDGRRGGDAIAGMVAACLRLAGKDVVSVGVCTTPTLAVAADAAEALAAVQVTASHNPQEWNGIKIMLGAPQGGPRDGTHACAPSKRMADDLIEAFQSGRRHFFKPHSDWEPHLGVGDLRKIADPIETHVSRVLRSPPCVPSAFPPGGDPSTTPSPVRVVLDSVNASGARAAEELLRRCRAYVVQLHGETHGRFPHVPEPTKENLSGAGGLCDAVVGLKADIGFAQDPDADRLAIVDEKGVYIGEEYTLSIAAEALLSHRESLKATIPPHVWKQTPVIVVNLSTSRMVDDVAARYGAEVIRTPVGEANVVERMKQLADEGRNVIVGGEGNGGVIWPKVCYVRDSLSAMALTLGLMARTGTSVSQIVDRINSYSPGGRGYCIVKRKTEIPSKAAAAPACEAVARAFAAERVDRQDGVRVDFSGKWAGCWVHVRASNTEPIMRLICEAPNQTLAAEVLSATERAIAGG